MARTVEDFEEGERWELGPVSVTREEILEFARAFDPQPFHVDDEAASRNFEGIIASGWHTAALCMRPFAREVLADVAVVAAQGIEDLRWYAPVYPGDELTVEVEVTDVATWSQDRGRVTFHLEATNQGGTLVHARDDLVIVERIG